MQELNNYRSELWGKLKEEKERSAELDKVREANFDGSAHGKENFIALGERIGGENVKACSGAEGLAREKIAQKDQKWEKSGGRRFGWLSGEVQRKTNKHRQRRYKGR